MLVSLGTTGATNSDFSVVETGAMGRASMQTR
jgi:hypothetical protein